MQCETWSVPGTWVLPTSPLGHTFLVCLVDSLDLLVVPCGQDFNEHFLICASPLEESGMGGVLQVAVAASPLQCQGSRDYSSHRATICQKSTSSNALKGR